jgi:hypothetical protein
LEVGTTGHSFGRAPSKDHSTKVWLQLAQWFLRRRIKCEKLTTDETWWLVSSRDPNDEYYCHHLLTLLSLDFLHFNLPQQRFGLGYSV